MGAKLLRLKHFSFSDLRLACLEWEEKMRTVRSATAISTSQSRSLEGSGDGPVRQASLPGAASRTVHGTPHTVTLQQAQAVSAGESHSDQSKMSCHPCVTETLSMATRSMNCIHRLETKTFVCWKFKGIVRPERRD